MADTYNLADGSIIEVESGSPTVTSAGVVTVSVTGETIFYFRKSPGSTRYKFQYKSDFITYTTLQLFINQVAGMP